MGFSECKQVYYSSACHVPSLVPSPLAESPQLPIIVCETPIPLPDHKQQLPHQPINSSRTNDTRGGWAKEPMSCHVCMSPQSCVTHKKKFQHGWQSALIVMYLLQDAIHGKDPPSGIHNTGAEDPKKYCSLPLFEITQLPPIMKGTCPSGS